MKRLHELVEDGNNSYGCSPNLYYYHFFAQVRIYYPNIQEKTAHFFAQEYDLWMNIIQKAKDNGEIRPNTNVKRAATMFKQNVFHLIIRAILLK